MFSGPLWASKCLQTSNALLYRLWFPCKPRICADTIWLVKYGSSPYVSWRNILTMIRSVDQYKQSVNPKLNLLNSMPVEKALIAWKIWCCNIFSLKTFPCESILSAEILRKLNVQSKWTWFTQILPNFFPTVDASKYWCLVPGKLSH